jgi:hypothetical protein
VTAHNAKLSKAQALALRLLKEAETSLVADKWAPLRDAAIKLAALAADRAAK